MSPIHIAAGKIAAVLEENAERFTLELGPEEIGHVLEAGDARATRAAVPFPAQLRRRAVGLTP
jgi:hypothetical protein